MPLSVKLVTFLLLWEQLVLMVELGKAKGQKRFVDDLMAADKSSITCTTGTSGQSESGHERMASMHGLLLLLAAAPVLSLAVSTPAIPPTSCTSRRRFAGFDLRRPW